MKSACFCLLGLTLALYTPAFAQPAPSTPAEMISDYRLQHGEGRVISDSKLIKIAQEQASAMASKQMLDHSVPAPENIAYGYDNFAKTLDLWIGSNGHRNNLLLHDASRVGVASSKNSEGRTYWAMVIAGGFKRTPTTNKTTKPQARRQGCTIAILGLSPCSTLMSVSPVQWMTRVGTWTEDRISLISI